MTFKAAILLFPGTNREHDMACALRTVTRQDPVVVWHQETQIPAVDLIVLPGGFSYGDYLRPGAIAARSPIMSDLFKKALDGVLVLGICNGFQILTEIGLLPGALLKNTTLKFMCKEAYLRVENTDTYFTHGYRNGEILRLPIANASGNYTADPETLTRLEEEGRVLLRYCDAEGKICDEENPGGSANAIAAISNESRNILGMMPHPENAVCSLAGGLDGIPLFESMSSCK